MTQKPLEPAKLRSLLRNIHEGMEVFDSNGDKVGTVDDLYFGADSDDMARHGAGAATAPDPSMRSETLVEDIADALFGNDNLPEEMRQRLLNNGFIRVDGSGFLASDLYVLPEQIASVDDDDVHLNVTREGLLKR
jgi:hypothetical protein